MVVNNVASLSLNDSNKAICFNIVVNRQFSNCTYAQQTRIPLQACCDFVGPVKLRAVHYLVFAQIALHSETCEVTNNQNTF